MAFRNTIKLRHGESTNLKHMATLTLLCNSNAHLLQVVTQYLIPLGSYTARGRGRYYRTGIVY